MADSKIIVQHICSLTYCYPLILFSLDNALLCAVVIRSVVKVSLDFFYLSRSLLIFQLLDCGG